MRRGVKLAPNAIPASAPWSLPNWTPQPKQVEFLDCSARELLFGGAAGGGKTDGLINWAIRNCKRYPGSHTILARRKLTQMRDTGAIMPRMAELLAGKGWSWRASDFRWTAPDGGTVEFKQAGQNLTECIDNWQGAAPHFLGIEEAGQIQGGQLDFMIGRVRTATLGMETQVRLTANPGGPGHSYLKSRFVDAAPPGQVWQPPARGSDTLPMTRCFVPALVTDNSALMAADPGYLANLENLPEPYRSAYRFGLWDLFIGQFFREWSPSVHVIDAFDIPAHWPRIAALDWGYNHPTVAYWAAVGPDGVVYVYREVRLRFRNVDGEDGLAKRFLGYGDNIQRFASGPDVFTMAKQVVGGPTIAELFQREGLFLTNSTAGKKRIHQWQQVRKYLQWRDANGERMAGKPLLRVFRGACPALETCLPEMQFSSSDSEDMEKVDIDLGTGEGGDDPADALAYLLMLRPFAGSEPAGPPPHPQSAAAYMERLEAQKKEKARRKLW